MAENLTFDAEGQEGGPYHSRELHVPGPTSGLTIGRGYDMKRRSADAVRQDMIDAGLDQAAAAMLAQAAGLSGDQAEQFIEDNDLEDFEISPEVQQALFDIEYERQLRDTRRLATKPDVVRVYGETDWDALNPVIREVLVDLRFRGDYTPACRKFLQVHVANNDLVAFAGEIGNRDRWPRVPVDRYARRRSLCETALT
ncbi:MAG: hypothetical protein HQ483_19980 [Rhodospirillales bacterium]|nr:hypothetical protein [Rhodospirillales bacterium]